MKTRIINLWERFRASYWFVPSVMVCASFALAAWLTSVDERLTLQEGKGAGWIYQGDPAGARTLLSTVAGSMITVAGVVFSITIVTLSLTSSQFGPRLLRNFLRDTANQIVLGTFVATFLYCLLLLRKVREGNGEAFVPHLGVTVAVLLALGGVGMLIYFIHHVATSIQANSIIGSVYRELQGSIDRLFPERPEASQSAATSEVSPEPDSRALRSDAAATVPARRSGYVQAIDVPGLLEMATDRDVLIVLRCRPSHFVMEGAEVAAVWPQDEMNDDFRRRIQKSLIVGSHRTAEQDVEFAVYQLVEVAVRALSPGINDPFTAMTCIDWLGAALLRLCARPLSSRLHYDHDGMLRVLTQPVSFAGIADAAFNQIRQSARGNVSVTIRLLEIIAVVTEHARDPARRSVLRHHAEMVYQQAKQSITEPRDLHDIAERVAALERSLQNPSDLQPINF